MTVSNFGMPLFWDIVGSIVEWKFSFLSHSFCDACHICKFYVWLDCQSTWTSYGGLLCLLVNIYGWALFLVPTLPCIVVTANLTPNWYRLTLTVLWQVLPLEFLKGNCCFSRTGSCGKYTRTSVFNDDNGFVCKTERLSKSEKSGYIHIHIMLLY